MAGRDSELIEQARRQAEQAGPTTHATVTLPTSSSIQASLPAEIGPIRLIREIGRGGMGVVYVGRDQMLGRAVAVKVLLDVVEGPDDPGFVRFLEGARAAAKVRHPGLTALYQADIVVGVPYLVMEFIDGPTLRDLLRQAGHLTMPAALAVTGAVAEAVAALHDQGIVHRDIKPQNVLLDRAGGVYVTDFGLASARAARSGPAEVAGTIPYMAPEMFDGEVSPRSDVYALGITLYELLTGELPFSGLAAEIRDQHRNRPLPDEPLRQREVPLGLIEVLERATHKNAMLRYRTAAHLVRSLKEAVPDNRVWSRGAAELVNEAARHRAAPVPESPAEGKTPSSASYYEHLSSIAATKRERPSGEDHPRMASATNRVENEGQTLMVPSHRPKASDILTLKKCPQCEYSLEGLPRCHRCPECGFEYDESTFVVYGWISKGHRPTPAAAVIGLLGWVPMLVWKVRAREWGWAAAFLAVGLVGYMGQWLWRRRQRARRGGAIQFTFSSKGAGQSHGPASPEFIPWSQFRLIRFEPVGRDVWRLRLSRGEWHLATFTAKPYTVTGQPWLEGVIECSRREAATIRGEIRRRMRGSAA